MFAKSILFGVGLGFLLFGCGNDDKIKTSAGGDLKGDYVVDVRWGCYASCERLKTVEAKP